MKRLLPVVRLGPQRNESDCAIVALAMLTGSSYEDILGLASAFLKAPHRRGMYLKDIKAVALALGYTLIYRRASQVDIWADTGLLSVENKEGGIHVVFLRWGLIFDDNEVWDPDVYLEEYNMTVTSLLLVRE